MLTGNAGEAPQLINKVLIEVRLHPHQISTYSSINSKLL